MKKLEKEKYYDKKKAKEDKRFNEVLKTYEKGGLKFKVE